MHVNIENEHDFLVHMIPHHQEAVDTAVYLRDNTDRPEMRRFAEDIIKTQSAEIALMIDWLETWYPHEQHSIDYQPMMRNLENLQGRPDVAGPLALLRLSSVAARKTIFLLLIPNLGALPLIKA